MSTYAIKADKFFLPAGPQLGGYLMVEDGVFGAWQADEPSCEIKDYTGSWIAPGMVDTHIHGFYNHSTTDNDPEGIDISSTELARRGTTSWLPTTFTDGVEQIKDACAAIAQADEGRGPDFCGARIQGIYLEGPFFTMKHVGAQNPAYLIDPSEEVFDQWQEAAGGRIVKSAMAAERDGAAAYAAANGLNFRVIEQNANVQDTRHWYGAVDSAAAKEAGEPATDKAKLLSEISRYASGKCDQRVVKTWINESAAMHDFMRSILEDKYGWVCDFTSGSEAAWPAENAEHNTDYLYPVQEHNYMASESASGTPRNELLLQYIQELGYDVDFKTSLAKLEKNSDGRITGIIAQSTEDDHFIRYNANQGVLLACGGFPGNPYMMEQLDPLGTSVTTACSYSPADKGYGIRAAVWAGANLDKEAAPMLFDRGIVAPGVDAGYVDSDSAFGGKAFPGKIRQYNPGTQPFLKVNRNGERFANESCPYNDIVYAAAHQPGRVYAQICDANILEDAKRFHTIGCSAQTRNGGEKYIQGKMDEAIEAGALFKCDTLDELADKMGFTGAAKDTFLATVERYNELYDKQNDEDFGKPAYRLSAIRTAPFYGCWLGASLLTTEQGIAINEKGQALDTNNQPMEGLYITGDMSGSFFANNYPCLMAGVAMGRTLTFAMKAVKQMAGLENA